MREYGFLLTCDLQFCPYTGEYWSGENPYSRIFYAVYHTDRRLSNFDSTCDKSKLKIPTELMNMMVFQERS